MKENNREREYSYPFIIKLSKGNLPLHQKHPSKEKAKGPDAQISAVGLLFSVNVNKTHYSLGIKANKKLISEQKKGKRQEKIAERENSEGKKKNTKKEQDNLTVRVIQD